MVSRFSRRLLSFLAFFLFQGSLPFGASQTSPSTATETSTSTINVTPLGTNSTTSPSVTSPSHNDNTRTSTFSPTSQGQLIVQRDGGSNTTTYLVSEGGSLVFKCIYTGQIVGQIVWTGPSAPDNIMNFKVNITTVSLFTLSNAAASDAGRYSCNANSVGGTNASLDFFLHVQGSSAKPWGFVGIGIGCVIVLILCAVLVVKRRALKMDLFIDNVETSQSSQDLRNVLHGPTNSVNSMDGDCAWPWNSRRTSLPGCPMEEVDTLSVANSISHADAAAKPRPLQGVVEDDATRPLASGVSTWGDAQSAAGSGVDDDCELAGQDGDVGMTSIILNLPPSTSKRSPSNIDELSSPPSSPKKGSLATMSAATRKKNIYLSLKERSGSTVKQFLSPSLTKGRKDSQNSQHQQEQSGKSRKDAEGTCTDELAFSYSLRCHDRQYMVGLENDILDAWGFGDPESSVAGIEDTISDSQKMPDDGDRAAENSSFSGNGEAPIVQRPAMPISLSKSIESILMSDGTAGTPRSQGKDAVIPTLQLDYTSLSRHGSMQQLQQPQDQQQQQQQHQEYHHAHTHQQQHHQPHHHYSPDHADESGGGGRGNAMGQDDAVFITPVQQQQLMVNGANLDLMSVVTSSCPTRCHPLDQRNSSPNSSLSLQDLEQQVSVSSSVTLCSCQGEV